LPYCEQAETASTQYMRNSLLKYSFLIIEIFYVLLLKMQRSSHFVCNNIKKI
jgi:hypothetical protein